MRARTISGSPAPMDRLRCAVHAETGIRLPPAKDLMIQSRLQRRVLYLGLPDLETYLSCLFDGGRLDAELPEIVDLLTTNKTDFFREEAHFRLLRDRIIPQALGRAPPGRTVRFRVWSAAASTGAEAWSAAMLLARAAEADPRLDWAILGTDISRRVLEGARRAIYSAEELRPVPEDLRCAYVMSGRAGTVARGRIVPELRARVRFAALNLMEAPYEVEAGLDVVFLRNVLIYFEPDVQRRVVAAVSRHLRPGGHLIVGHTESMNVNEASLSQIAPGAFRQTKGTR
ncbi:CheR family methyltransferase [Roseivivax sediminis]|uniref:Chemotaxis protein methyltransferase n=1 Tax=Roseivivax sediminis TaxID=936889 RepID=A0A1I1UNQ6_9RHOB|nr:CheR family methyltransferase [Roseivivax sediminis]SFD72461.1 chemotaxis protein methyltransferase CheR [Roseivivax sediminis]